MSTSSLSCVECRSVINCDIPKRRLVVTKCFHAYCIQCLKGWVSAMEKPCPLCREVIYRNKSGKDFTVIWSIFVKIFRRDPEYISKVLKDKGDTGDHCCSCLEDFPALRVQYDAEKRAFKHTTCAAVASNEITVRDVIKVVQLYASEHTTLKQKLTPPPPVPLTYIEKFLNIFSR